MVEIFNNKVLLFLVLLTNMGCKQINNHEHLKNIIDLGIEEKFQGYQFGPFREELYYFQLPDSTLILFKTGVSNKINIVSINSEFNNKAKLDSIHKAYSDTLALLIQYSQKFYVEQISSDPSKLTIRTSLYDSSYNEIKQKFDYYHDFEVDEGIYKNVEERPYKYVLVKFREDQSNSFKDMERKKFLIKGIDSWYYYRTYN